MFGCPNCGESVPDNAKSCPHCGSDEETGWNPDVDYYSVDLPEEEKEHQPIGNGISVPFAVFLVILVLLGLTAISGLSTLSTPFSLIGILMIIAAVLFYLGALKRFRR